MHKTAIALALLLTVSCVRPELRPRIDPMGNGGAREKWLFEQRAFPFGDIPADARRNAIEQVRERERMRGALENATATAAPRWQAIGPLPVQTRWPWKTATGRVKSVAIAPHDPNIVLAGSSSGGIWRSTDAGLTFTPVSDGHSDLSVGAIAFAPSSPNVVYAVSGSDFLGTGVLRSNDSGATWQVVDDPTFAPRGKANRMVVDPSDAGRLWVAQTSLQDAASGSVFSSGLLRSDDDGFSWTTLFRGLVSDFAAAPGSNSTFLLGVPRRDSAGGGSGLYRSTDAGQSWVAVVPGKGSFPHFTFAFSPASPSRVYLHSSMDSKARIHVSNDGGMTWSEIAPTLPAGRSSFLVAHPSRSNEIYLGYPGGDLHTSTDGGATWRNITTNRSAEGEFDPASSLTHIDQHVLVFSPSDERVLYLGNDGGIYKSTDGGTTFTSLAGTLSLVQAYGIAAHPSDPAVLFLGTQDNGLERRRNGEWRELITGDYGSILFDARNPGTLITNYVYGNLFAFSQHGDAYLDTRANNATFEETEPYRIKFIAPFERHPRTNTLYFGTWRLFASTDFGRNWTSLGGGIDLTRGGADTLSAIGLSPGDANTIYTASGRGQVMRSRDAGGSWTDITGSLPQRHVKAITVDPLDPNVAWIAFSGYRTAHVHRTTDGGATWQAVSDGLPDVPVNALLIAPSSRHVLYAGTDIGVFVLDAGVIAEWQYLGDGMPPVVVTSFDVTADGRIVAATYGRGAYELVTEGRKRRRAARP
ncbi:MAG TPA: hypothetical protein VNI54_12455 [Thermoanaerobaculia bacterium]|nr:hypothetical protein [Thermoanaerobaculia bacterium]